LQVSTLTEQLAAAQAATDSAAAQSSAADELQVALSAAEERHAAAMATLQQRLADTEAELGDVRVRTVPCVCRKHIHGHGCVEHVAQKRFILTLGASLSRNSALAWLG